MRQAVRLLFVGIGPLSIAAFLVGLLMFVLTQETKASPWYEVAMALFFGGLGAFLLLGTIMWVIASIGSHPAASSALVGMAGTVSMMLGVVGLMLALVVAAGRGARAIDGDEPMLRISFGLLALGMILIGLAPPPAVAARMASFVDPIVQAFPRLRSVFALFGWLARAVCAASGGYLVWRLVIA